MNKNILLSNQKIKKIAKLNEIVIGHIIIIAFGSLIIDSYTYPGFLSKIVVVHSSTLFYLSFLSLFLYTVNRFVVSQKRISIPFSILLKLNFLIFPFLFILFFGLVQIERQTYSNYIFSTYHIQIPVMFKIIFLSGALFGIRLVDEILNATNKIESKKSMFLKTFNNYDTNKTIFFLVMAVIVTIQVVNTLSLIGKASLSSIKMILHTFEERKSIVFGDPYLVYSFINENTEQNSIIAVAPQSIEGIFGNIGFSRYFLHPRFMVHPEQDNIQIEDTDYVLISSYAIGENKFEMWPKKNFKVLGGYTIDRFTSEIVKIDVSEYIYGDSIYLNKISLLKVNKSENN